MCQHLVCFKNSNSISRVVQAVKVKLQAIGLLYWTTVVYMVGKSTYMQRESVDPAMLIAKFGVVNCYETKVKKRPTQEFEVALLILNSNFERCFTFCIDVKDKYSKSLGNA